MVLYLPFFSNKESCARLPFRHESAGFEGGRLLKNIRKRRMYSGLNNRNERRRIIFKYCLRLGLPLLRSILSITRKRLEFDSVGEFSYFISFGEKNKKDIQRKEGCRHGLRNSWSKLRPITVGFIAKDIKALHTRWPLRKLPILASLSISWNQLIISDDQHFFADFMYQGVQANPILMPSNVLIGKFFSVTWKSQGESSSCPLQLEATHES